MSTIELHFGSHELWLRELNPQFALRFPGHRTLEVLENIGGHVYKGRCIFTTLPAFPVGVALKIARGVTELDYLVREANLYQHQLLLLQGDVVPEFYGLYTGTDDGDPVGCLVLQLCTKPVVLDQAEFGRQVMLAVCKLHAAGVTHGDLTDTHHVVRLDQGLGLVDFSSASDHNCRGGIPKLVGLNLTLPISECRELVTLERNVFGILDYPSHPHCVPAVGPVHFRLPSFAWKQHDS